MGDLAFGESLGMLEKSQYTPWVSAIFGNIRLGNIDRFSREYPKFRYLLEAVQPKYMAELRQSHLNHSIERVDRRLEKGIDIGKPDIWKLVLEKGKELLTIPSMHAHASLFMIAGTETTATLLSGLTFLLLRNTEKMQKLLEEVRALPEEELSLVVLPKLPYLNACFEEGLRCYPPVPCGVPRQVAQGGNVICGEWVPEGVCPVSIVLRWSANSNHDLDTRRCGTTRRILFSHKLQESRFIHTRTMATEYRI